MDITVSVLLKSAERRQRYKNTIEQIIRCGLNTPYVRMYGSLEEIRSAMLEGKQRADILIMQAEKRNFEFAKELRMEDRNCVIIYPASDMNFVLEAFDAMPIAYAVPRKNAEGRLTNTLSDAIVKAVEMIKNSKSEIKFETKSRVLSYALYEIDYMESQYRLVHIHKRSGTHDTVNAKLDDVQAMLPRSFARCHKSYLVNMDNIDYIDKTNKEIVFVSGQSVPASKNMFTDFLNAYRRMRGEECPIEEI